MLIHSVFFPFQLSPRLDDELGLLEEAASILGNIFMSVNSILSVNDK